MSLECSVFIGTISEVILKSTHSYGLYTHVRAVKCWGFIIPPCHRFWEQQYFPIWTNLSWFSGSSIWLEIKKHGIDLIHATYLFLLELGFLCYFALLLLETRFGGCHGNGEITTQTRPNGMHTHKKKKQSKNNPFYYQIITAFLFVISIVLPYGSGIYGVPSVCLELYRTQNH